jgi:hypothetical protein
VAEGSPDGAALLEVTRTALGKARNSLDSNKPQFSQVELCEVAEIPMATAEDEIFCSVFMTLTCLASYQLWPSVVLLAMPAYVGVIRSQRYSSED